MLISDFLEKVEESDLMVSDVLELIFKGGYVKKENFPEAFDSKGNVVLEFKDKPVYNTFCPFHPGQRNGDSFAIYNNDKNCYCYNGSCNFSKRPINVVELVLATVFKLDHSIIFEFELAKEHYFKAQKFLVDHFGEILGLTEKDLRDFSKRKKDPIEKILEDAVDYYHFLGTKTEFYRKKINDFLIEQRHLHNGVVPIEKLKETYKIGVTPYSETMDKLYQYLRKRGHSKEKILESKVCYVKNGEIRDFFINRAIIPYIHKNKVIGIYGRDLDPNGKKEHRHLRLEGSVRVPNGLDKILEQEEFFLPEGEFSKIAVAALGYPNVMEARGVNGFKEEHAELIKKVRLRNPDKCKRCYLLFDPDDAGADSVEKIGKRLIDVGVEVLVIRLPIFYEKEETIYIDPNDLLKIYGKKAKEEFEKLKENAISYDCFMFLHKLEKNRPKTLSEARMAFKNLSKHLDNIPKIERIFVLEEILQHLETVMEKNILRDYLKELWINEKPSIEGLNEAFASNSPVFLLTKSEEFYKQHKKEIPYLVLIRDTSVLKTRRIERKILLDTTFTEEEQEKYFTYQKVGRGKIKVKEGGRISIQLITKQHNQKETKQYYKNKRG